MPEHLGQSETWRDQPWRDLRCPRCNRTTFGPEGSTYCGWHRMPDGEHADVLMVPFTSRVVQPTSRGQSGGSLGGSDAHGS